MARDAAMSLGVAVLIVAIVAVAARARGRLCSMGGWMMICWRKYSRLFSRLDINIVIATKNRLK